ETVIRSHGLLEDLSVDALLSQASEYFSKFTGLSARCQGVRFKYDMLMELTRREKIAGIRHEEDLDIFMKALVLGEHETALVVEYILKAWVHVQIPWLEMKGSGVYPVDKRHVAQQVKY
ncbi:hypothetical protein Tco_1527147, partial [Tanacetum coccineum]